VRLLFIPALFTTPDIVVDTEVSFSKLFGSAVSEVPSTVINRCRRCRLCMCSLDGRCCFEKTGKKGKNV
jgi:hypothetical protein